MRPPLRWLAFFIIGDVLMGVGAVVVVVPLGLVVLFLGALWEAGFNLQVGAYFFAFRVEQTPPVPSLLAMALFLPGLFGAFSLARWSLNNDGWRFWRWHG